MFKGIIVELLVEETKLHVDETTKLLETPPRLEMGDFSFPCFRFTNPEKDDPMWKDVEHDFFKRKNPVDIAKHFTDQINDRKLPKEIEKVIAVGPYVNFFLNKKILAQKIIKVGANFGKGKESRKILVEYASPNSNKPLHLGHLRNMALGESMSRIFEFMGNKVIRTNINNDRGMGVIKAMLMYKKFGKNKTPESEKMKSDHFVGDLYVLYGKKENPKLEEESRELLKLQESGDKETLKLWKKIVDWALSGYNQTYKTLGVKFRKEYYESRIFESGRDIVMKGLKDGIFKKRRDNAIVINLGFMGKEDMGEKVLLRPDGTSVYMTQDIELARQKNNDFNPDLLINVVGNEHDYHFKVLYEILRKLGNKEQHHHLSYGIISLPEGRMKSREGTVVDADNLIDNVKEMAKKNLLDRNKKLTKKIVEERSLMISLAAIKYTLLKIEAARNFMFDPKESISFEGNTGPYLQYSYARASSIVRKSKTKKQLKIPDNLSKSELQLLSQISKFPQIVENAAEQMNPALIANYAYQLAQNFNEFYHANPVIGSKEEAFRLKLINSFRVILKNSLYLLGIDVMEEM
ncbi:MAG TPA: arginine--tRNA ligase [Candidatus Pacearchaeota archaeon]|nr:arginine--tRNA ligase [Candidatus Pacearchaeota archaeon]